MTIATKVEKVTIVAIVTIAAIVEKVSIVIIAVIVTFSEKQVFSLGSRSSFEKQYLVDCLQRSFGDRYS